MGIITAIIIMFSGSILPEEVINMPTMYIVARTYRQTPWEVAMETIRIMRKYAPTPLDIKMEF